MLRPQYFTLTEDDHEIIFSLEIEIDRQLSRRFKKTAPRTEVLVGSLTEQVFDEITRRYREVGWKVEQGFSHHHLAFRI